MVHFKTQPAKVAVVLAEAEGKTLSLEQAKQNVEDSHARFQEDVERLLGQHNIPYSITSKYTAALNGVAIMLPGNQIMTLAQSHEIQAIYYNEEFHIEPPIQPM
ncbi:protease inhibitor I9 family protein [Bacillus sp. 165]|uniref:protease inhibitor I9 family protein n=1 Tax=Bacillus sp. 165 TaxID=1529117 RepID=UPI0032AF87FB